ncbi:MAG: hypothetical protein AMJ41_04960 [candidate division Zixibacteria bacterium DG_27]|nr:MAG: hypothetical protein AMJ41_04960 [candidate division Zixibacteria bacterium DG_27]
MKLLFFCSSFYVSSSRRSLICPLLAWARLGYIDSPIPVERNFLQDKLKSVKSIGIASLLFEGQKQYRQA